MVDARAHTDNRLTNPIQFRSKTEEIFAMLGAGLVSQHCAKPVVIMKYEPITFNLPGGRYTPDFMVIFEDGEILFIEIKGSKRQKNYRDARSKLRSAHAIHPYFTWAEIRIKVTRNTVTSCEIEIIGEDNG